MLVEVRSEHPAGSASEILQIMLGEPHLAVADVDDLETAMAESG